MLATATIDRPILLRQRRDLFVREQWFAGERHFVLHDPLALTYAWLTEIEHADLGALSDRAIYNDVAALGLSIFDLPGKRAERLRADWAPLLGYVGGTG